MDQQDPSLSMRQFVSSRLVQTHFDPILHLIEAKAIDDPLWSAWDPPLPSVAVILFYTDWCRHCQRLMPIWQQLVAHFKTAINVALISVNETSQTFGYVVCYPTILRLQRNYGTLHFTTYPAESNRTLADLIQFVNTEIIPLSLRELCLQQLVKTDFQEFHNNPEIGAMFEEDVKRLTFV